MGAKHSSISVASCESNRNDVSFDPGDTSENPPLQSGTPASVPRLPPPQLMRPETFEEKLYRKFKAEPLVPIGCLTTAFFLGSGIKSFYNRDPKKSQTMMRLRVGSQFATIMIFIGYAGMNAFTWTTSPTAAGQLPGVTQRSKERGE